MYKMATDLFPILRSITGEGVRTTLKYIKCLIPHLQIHSIPSGTKAYDWTVPEEWVITEGYIEDEEGKRIIDIKEHNLHIVGYSEPIDKWLYLNELDKYLYSLPEQPNAIPYVTSYYQRRWGFCLTHNQRLKLKQGKYHVVIKSEFISGVMNYGELIIPGDTEQEILLSTYICHPSMANNEISGLVVMTKLCQWLSKKKVRRYTYRILFIPETIGSIFYLSRNLEQLKKNVVAGYVLTCLGDNKEFSFIPSRKGNTLADRAARHVLSKESHKFKEYSFLERGSDERQYCSPGVDLPIGSIMRSKYGTFPEYHTSLDNLNFIKATSLKESFKIFKKVIITIENNCIPKTTVICEPNLSKRGLYPTISIKNNNLKVRNILNLMAYSDGSCDLLEIADIIGMPMWEIEPIMNQLFHNDLICYLNEKL